MTKDTEADFSNIAALSRPDAWRRIAPDFELSGLPFANCNKLSLPSDTIADAGAYLLQEGYFVLPGVFTQTESRRAAELIQTVTAAGWPPPFALVYDHIWNLLGRLAPLFAQIYGEPPLILPDFWVWQLDGRYETSGWGWHRDDKFNRECFDAAGHPLVLTVWLPFTDTNADNGCIQVLPRSVDSTDELDRMSLRPELKSSVRNLPAPAGSVLAWDMYVLHRGGRLTAKAACPRISLGIYFQSPRIEALDGHAIIPGDRLSLLERLGVVSRMVLRYANLYPFDPALIDSCTKWAELYSLAHKLPRPATE